VAYDIFFSKRVGIQRQESDLCNACYSHPRVSAVVAIDTGFVRGLEAADVIGLVPRAVLIGFGDRDTQMSAIDATVNGRAALALDARVVQLALAFHFMAMSM